MMVTMGREFGGGSTKLTVLDALADYPKLSCTARVNVAGPERLNDCVAEHPFIDQGRRSIVQLRPLHGSARVDRRRTVAEEIDRLVSKVCGIRGGRPNRGHRRREIDLIVDGFASRRAVFVAQGDCSFAGPRRHKAIADEAAGPHRAVDVMLPVKPQAVRAAAGVRRGGLEHRGLAEAVWPRTIVLVAE
jgi:hypothetical protein